MKRPKPKDLQAVAGDAELRDLKAKAYDVIGVMEQAQKALRQINARIGELEQAKQAPKKPELKAVPEQKEQQA